MVEPVSLVIVSVIAIGGFIGGYFVSKAANPQKVENNADQLHNVVVQNIKDTVQVQDHPMLIIGVFIIIALLSLIIVVLFVQLCARRIKKRTLRRVLSGREIQNGTAVDNA